MLIESLIKPEPRFKSRTVDVFGVRYEFEEVQKGRFVASVMDPAAIECLTKNKAFAEYTDTLLQQGTSTLASTLDASTGKVDPPAPPAPKKADKPAAPAPATEPADGTSTASEVEIQAQALLSSTPTAIKKQLEKNIPSADVLKAAITIEKAAKAPRQHVLSGLTGALSSLEA